MTTTHRWGSPEATITLEIRKTVFDSVASLLAYSLHFSDTDVEAGLNVAADEGGSRAREDSFVP